MMQPAFRVVRVVGFVLGLATNSPLVSAQADGGPRGEQREAGSKPDADRATTSGSTLAPSALTPSAPQASSDDIDGETMFATSCGWCHAQGGRAAGRGPKLAGTKRSDEFIIDRVKHGKPGAMPAFGRAFSEAQIIAILAYIRSLDVLEK